jgi:hypothetical protein
MSLTGDPTGPPLAPAGDLTGFLDELAGELLGLTGVTLDAPALLGERAALRRLRRGGRWSCGGKTRLVRCADGWAAIALVRPEDEVAVAPLLGHEIAGPVWDAVEAGFAVRSVEELAERAVLLSVPFGVVPAVPAYGAAAPADGADPGSTSRVGAPGAPRALSGVTVADLSSLWAGPLCTGLLAAGGATVTKVESRSRPDGARRASRRFWRLLNGDKAEQLVDPGQLRDHVEAADVVVLAARRRAYEQLGIDVDGLLRSRSDKVIVAITGHGWDDGRVGFGDDAAVAGGLVARHPVDGEPRFLADAVADPVTGLQAAVAAARSVVEGGRWFVDISLAGVSAGLAARARTDLPALAATAAGRGWVLDGERVRPPRARSSPA